MRRLVLMFPLLLVAASAAAQRPSTLNMTCGEASDLIASQGEIVLTTGANTFERFVTGPGGCRVGEHAETGYAQTSDRNRCRLHYICKPGRTQFEDFD
jgi:hypothetical protein